LDALDEDEGSVFADGEIDREGPNDNSTDLHAQHT